MMFIDVSGTNNSIMVEYQHRKIYNYEQLCDLFYYVFRDDVKNWYKLTVTRTSVHSRVKGIEFSDEIFLFLLSIFRILIS